MTQVTNATTIGAIKRTTAWSKCPLGRAPARLLHLLRARLAALGSSALPGKDPQPLPRVLELAASKAADFPWDHSGMGIIDRAIQSHAPAGHVIVEAHPMVHAKMLADGWGDRPNVRCLLGLPITTYHLRSYC